MANGHKLKQIHNNNRRRYISRLVQSQVASLLLVHIFVWHTSNTHNYQQKNHSLFSPKPGAHSLSR